MDKQPISQTQTSPSLTGGVGGGSFKPADRLSSIQEYYFSRKLKEVAKLNAEGKNIISLAIGSPDMPPSEHAIEGHNCLAFSPSDRDCHRAST